jgi:hypothetical protein
MGIKRGYGDKTRYDIKYYNALKRYCKKYTKKTSKFENLFNVSISK